MPLRDPIDWGPQIPFSDPRLLRYDLVDLVRKFRSGWSSKGWVAHEFVNWHLDLPIKPPGYSVSIRWEPPQNPAIS